jgi:HD-like signal output (HDOD) protein
MASRDMNKQEQAIFHAIKEAIATNRIILPSLPEVALRVREMCGQDDVSHTQLEKEISKDAAISARLFKVANSSALYSSRPLTSLGQAITRLGLNLVRSLVTQLSILQTMQGDHNDDRLRGFAASGLRISAISHTLAMSQPHLDAEQAALAGLVHDIGKLPLRSYLEADAQLSQDQQLCQQLELALHPAVGGLLLRHWKFPDELVQAAEEHEDMERDPAVKADYADLVIAANLLHYGTDTGRYAHLAEKRIPAMEKCNTAENDDKWETKLEQRLELSLSLLSA